MSQNNRKYNKVMENINYNKNELKKATRPYQLFQSSLGLELFSYGIICIICMVLIYKYSFDEKGHPTCKNYIFNSYVYIVLALAIMLIMIFALENSFIDPYIAKSPGILLIMCLIILITMRYLIAAYVKPTSIVTINLLWLIGIFALALIPIILVSYSSGIKTLVLSNLNDVVYIGGIFSILIVVAIGLLNTYVDYFTTIDWDYYLGWLLYTFIVVLVVASSYINDTKSMLSFIKRFTYFAIFIFVMILFSYHKDLMKNSETCKMANYPSESFGLIYKIRRIIVDFIYMIIGGRICK